MNAPDLIFTRQCTSYTAPATLITPSCKLAKNTTDGWTKTLYTAGDPTTYASREDFMAATMNGSATPVFTVTVRMLPLWAICAWALPILSDAAWQTSSLHVRGVPLQSLLVGQMGLRAAEKLSYYLPPGVYTGCT